MKQLIYWQCAILLLVVNFCLFDITKASMNDDYNEFITIAILAKDKAHVLDFYLSCIEAQTWPANQTYLYIRTNNNNDETAQILRDWVARIGYKYPKIYFDDTNVDVPVEQYGQHEWNGDRFKVLGKIRQDSVDWAFANASHYFVVDCDNFILPDTLQCMMDSNQPIVAPLLYCNENSLYSNYHFAIDENGYCQNSPFYYNVYFREIKGFIEVPVVHCVYFIDYNVLNKIYYDDDSWRYEYVIFSESARLNNIAQYLDNRKVYGYISFAESKEEFDKQRPFLNSFFAININGY